MFSLYAIHISVSTVREHRDVTADLPVYGSWSHVVLLFSVNVSSEYCNNTSFNCSNEFTSHMSSSENATVANTMTLSGEQAENAHQGLRQSVSETVSL